MKFKDIKTTKFNSALLFVFSALLFFSCNDPDGKGSPPPLNSEMIGKWNLVSGVRKTCQRTKRQNSSVRMSSGWHLYSLTTVAGIQELRVIF